MNTRHYVRVENMREGYARTALVLELDDGSDISAPRVQRTYLETTFYDAKHGFQDNLERMLDDRDMINYYGNNTADHVHSILKAAGYTEIAPVTI